ncbi:VOC family protein [Colwellia sp. RSH04]|uniref:VOC family protein n=1 Tax=Colwellia sp. RSH04 TaxID=2305464 RepID=UPI000E57A82E|nr:VOC family protein [Colwellia sp. RSH04]RHW74699.1 VOC family protein [Colwellia sp. RSH04]
MISISGIDHIVLRTNCLEDMLNFYCHVLGCEVERTTEKALGLTQLRAGNALIDLVDIQGELGRAGGKAPTALDNNVDHFCLQLNDKSIDEVSKYLLLQNIDTGKFQERYGAQGFGQSIYINDPQGNTVELRIQAT